ncbi:Nitric oxide dioxygenase (Pi-NOD1) [Phytophthora megakarya]|uniref:Nitric oxide dioxygenase (Pi-NOD1) n=1 Tax=Phytophthora megakarya TaxID=4795 RepID=A0A225VD94_9STRA|nr:Nitric oxide dioxygenase (Pi-NOD1) [Phytophthora megakarya]
MNSKICLLRVARNEKNSDEITSLYLENADETIPLMRFPPGQYISLKIDNLRKVALFISSAPSQSFYRISAKKEFGDVDKGIPAGVVSSHPHDAIEVGHNLQVGCRHFYLETEKSSIKPLVFLSGGVGF